MIVPVLNLGLSPQGQGTRHGHDTEEGDGTDLFVLRVDPRSLFYRTQSSPGSPREPSDWADIGW